MDAWEIAIVGLGVWSLILTISVIVAYQKIRALKK